MIGLMEPYNTLTAETYPDQLCEVFNAIDTFGTKQFSLHFLNRIWAEENPDTAKAFVMGIVDSINWIEENQDEARKIISKYTGIPEEYVPDYHYQENGAVIMDDMQFWYDYMQRGSDNPVDWLDINTIATNKYNDYYTQTGGTKK